MNEFLIYLGVAALTMLLFNLWYQRQGKSVEKKWLIKQLKTIPSDQQTNYLAALKKIELQKTKSAHITLLITLMILPATFLIDYLWFHDIPIEQRTTVNTNNETPDLATAIKQLEQKLAENPDDVEGQLLYARSMMSMQNYSAAVDAYQRANEIEPNNPYILTDLAEATAFKNDTGSFLGAPETYLKQAMSIDPKNQKAMWLQGIVYYENQQFDQAETLWTELFSLVENEKIKATIGKQINMARAALNKPPIENETPSNDISYYVVVDASDAVKSMTLDNNARIFIYAKQTNGPPMPIAAVPVSAPFSWPIAVTITDQNSLNPERKLSQFEQLEFSAKLSMTGNATPAENDLFSEIKQVDQSKTNIHLTLTKD